MTYERTAKHNNLERERMMNTLVEAEDAYKLADAMLAEKDRNDENQEDY